MSAEVDLSQRRCSVYPDRPAVAQCPECRQYFSRECIVEHEGRYLCASCLEGMTRPGEKAGRRVRLPLPLVPFFQLAAAVAAMWFLYFMIARLLILIPSEFHEGTIWTN